MGVSSTGFYGNGSTVMLENFDGFPDPTDSKAMGKQFACACIDE